MKIYTKTGDGGDTSLFSGGRVKKDNLRVEAYGTVDELNALLGVARAHGPSLQTDRWLETVQNQLFHLGADLATPRDAASQHVVRMDADTIAYLESSIDRMSDDLEPLKQFILPGGCLVSAQLQVARTVCRRAERVTVALMEQADVGDLPQVYLNRLSDWLFVLARWENKISSVSESKWAAH